MTAVRFPIRIGRRSSLLLRVVFGVTPQRAWTELDDVEVRVRFGRFAFAAPVANLTRWRIEGPWAWLTAIGLRRSVRHGDVSFAGSPRGGVRLDFATPVRWWRLRVPAIYCGVDDLDGFAAALAARDIPGEDARRG